MTNSINNPSELLPSIHAGLADERKEAAQSHLELGLANWPWTATPLEASGAYLELTSMYSHRGDGIPTQYTHSPKVAEAARVMWSALMSALRTPTVTEEAERDKERLDFLDECSIRLNAKYGTSYGWKLILNHNVSMLVVGQMEVDLHDSQGGNSKLPSCRAAIDEQMRDLGRSTSPVAVTEGEGSALVRKLTERSADLCRLHDKMLRAVQQQRPYPVSIALGDDDTCAVLYAAVALERAAAALRTSPPPGIREAVLEEAALAKIIVDWFEDGGGCVDGPDWDWDDDCAADRAKGAAREIIRALTPNPTTIQGEDGK